MKYFVKYSAGMCGTDHCELVEADSVEDAASIYECEAWEWFWNFNDEADFEDMEPELDIYAELYDPKKHSMHL